MFGVLGYLGQGFSSEVFTPVLLELFTVDVTLNVTDFTVFAAFTLLNIRIMGI